jgi:hypothetical protein
MEDEKAATVVQEPVVTEEGFRGAAEAAETTPKPAATEIPAGESGGAVTGAGAAEPKVPSTWEELEQTEWFATAFEEKKVAFLEEAKPDILSEARREAIHSFDPSHQRAEAHLGDLAKTGQGMGRSLRDAIESVGEGGDAKTMQRAIQRVIDDNPGFIEMVNSSMHSSGMDSALRKLANASGDPNLLPDVYLRLKNDPNMGDEGFVREVLVRLTEARIKDSFISKEASDKALKAKDEEIAKLKAGVNQDKAKTRSEGPEKLPGSAGGGDDKKRLLDPNTPIGEVREIRARQIAAGG